MCKHRWIGHAKAQRERLVMGNRIPPRSLMNLWINVFKGAWKVLKLYWRGIAWGVVKGKGEIILLQNDLEAEVRKEV